MCFGRKQEELQLWILDFAEYAIFEWDQSQGLFSIEQPLPDPGDDGPFGTIKSLPISGKEKSRPARDGSSNSFFRDYFRRPSEAMRDS